MSEGMRMWGEPGGGRDPIPAAEAVEGRGLASISGPCTRGPGFGARRVHTPRLAADSNPCQVELHGRFGSEGLGTPLDLYRLAVGLLANATGAGGAFQPENVRAALGCLGRAEDLASTVGETGSPRAVEEKQRRGVAAATAQLLLGDVEASKRDLGWDEGSGPKDRQIAAFVKVG